MKVLIKERLSEHKYKTPEGYLVCVDSVLARTGKQEYSRDEIFKDGKDEMIEVDRPENEVFSPKTLASFENKPITLTHPDEDVTVENHREYSMGFVRDVHKGMDEGKPVMLGTLVVTDKEAVEAIESGEYTDLSCGYDCDIDDSDNPYQRNIRGNHVALCREGRAGNARVVDSIKDSISDSLDNRELKIFAQKILQVENEKELSDVIFEISRLDKNLANKLRSINNGGFEYRKGKISDIIMLEIQDSIQDVKPHAGESKEDFIERFMTATKSEYPDEKQRFAVANSYWNRRDSMKDGFGILSFDQENKIRKYCQKYGIDFNKVYKTIEEMNIKYPRMKIDDIIESILDDAVSGFYDSMKDVDNKKIKIGSTLVLKNEENNNMSINKVLKEMPDYYLVKNRNDIVHKIYKDKLYLWEVINDSIDDIDSYAKVTGSLEEEANQMDGLINDKVIHKGNGEVHFFYRRNGKEVEVRAWNVHKLNGQEIDKISKKYNVRISYVDEDYCNIYSTSNNIENVCRAFNAINPYYSVSDLLKMNMSDSIDDIDPYAKVTGEMEEDLEHFEDSNEDLWFKMMDKYVVAYKFIKGGYGIQFESFDDYQKAKELARKVGMNSGHWYDRQLQHFDYGSERIGNDSIRDRYLRGDSVEDVPVGFDPKIENRRIISWKNIHTPGSLKEELNRWISASAFEKKDLENRIKTHVDEVLKDYQHDKMKVDKNDLSAHYTKYNSVIGEINNKLKTNYRLFDSKLDKVIKVVKTIHTAKNSK